MADNFPPMTLFGARGAGKNPKHSLNVSLTRKGALAVMQAATLEAALIAHAPDAILFVDCTGVIRLWNWRAETLFGYSAEEAVGHTLDLIVPEPMRAAHWAGFSRAVQQGHFTKDTVLQTSWALTKDGRRIAVELSAAIIRSTSGQVQGIMAIGRNVTERRAHEQAQQERLARLERQVTALTQGSARGGDGSKARCEG
jgi:PAS domain S-box-containing protein